MDVVEREHEEVDQVYQCREKRVTKLQDQNLGIALPAHLDKRLRYTCVFFQEFLCPTPCASKCMSRCGEQAVGAGMRSFGSPWAVERDRERSKESLIDAFVKTVARNCILLGVILCE